MPDHKVASENAASLREAEMLRGLKHPNIVKYIDQFSLSDGRLCIVQEFADGKWTSFFIKRCCRRRLVLKDEEEPWQRIL